MGLTDAVPRLRSLLLPLDIEMGLMDAVSRLRSLLLLPLDIEVSLMDVVARLRSLLLIPLMAAVARAHCALCTAAVGATAITMKYFGLDASVIGLFVGAFGVSTGMWFGKKIKEYVPYQLHLLILASFVLTTVPLSGTVSEPIYLPVLLFGAPGSVFNKVYWPDKFLIGSVLGGILALVAYYAHITIKRHRGGVLFPYQGIALTIGILVIAGACLQLLLG